MLCLGLNAFAPHFLPSLFYSWWIVGVAVEILSIHVFLTILHYNFFKISLLLFLLSQSHHKKFLFHSQFHELYMLIFFTLSRIVVVFLCWYLIRWYSIGVEFIQILRISAVNCHNLAFIDLNTGVTSLANHLVEAIAHLLFLQFDLVVVSLEDIIGIPAHQQILIYELVRVSALDHFFFLFSLNCYLTASSLRDLGGRRGILLVRLCHKVFDAWVTACICLLDHSMLLFYQIGWGSPLSWLGRRCNRFWTVLPLFIFRALLGKTSKFAYQFICHVQGRLMSKWSWGLTVDVRESSLLVVNCSTRFWRSHTSQFAIGYI